MVGGPKVKKKSAAVEQKGGKRGEEEYNKKENTRDTAAHGRALHKGG